MSKRLLEIVSATAMIVALAWYALTPNDARHRRESLLVSGLKAFQDGQCEEAIRNLEELLAASEGVDHYEPYYALAESYIDCGRGRREAEKVLRAGIAKLGGRGGDSLRDTLATMYLEDGDYEAARSQYRLMATLTKAEKSLALGWVYFGEKDFARAKSLLEDAASADPEVSKRDFAGGRLNVYILISAASLKLGKVNDAIEVLRRALDSRFVERAEVQASGLPSEVKSAVLER